MAKYGNSHARVLAASTLTLVNSVTDTEAGYFGIYSVDFSPDGSKIVSGSSSGMIKIWDCEQPFQTCPDAQIWQLIHVCLLAATTLNELESASTGTTSRSVDFSPDGTKIVSGHNDGTIKVWIKVGGGERRFKPPLPEVW